MEGKKTEPGRMRRKQRRPLRGGVELEGGFCNGNYNRGSRASVLCGGL